MLSTATVAATAPCRAPARPFTWRRSRLHVRVRAQEGEGDRKMEDLFEQELRRRGLDTTSSVSDDTLDTGSAAPRSPFGQQSRQQRSGPRPPPSFRGEYDEEVPPQLAKSRALNSEGLEGFIPRASELLKLGVTFFLAFLPLLAVTSLAFYAVYAVFGDSFVHGGSPVTSPPPYYDPDQLLAEPTADPMVPLDLR